LDQRQARPPMLYSQVGQDVLTLGVLGHAYGFVPVIRIQI
jgi:hypothetical protein